jgi:RNA polymerase sigma-70 factor (ECF subfamily)
MPEHDAARNLRGDAALLARLRGGDEFAFDTLVRTYAGPLIRHATWIVGSADTAQDVVQEVFLYLWRERSRIEASWDIAAYLYGMTRNRARDIMRSEQSAQVRESQWVREVKEDVGPDLVDEVAMEAADMRKKVWDALAGVPPRCREIFMLVWDRQLPYREIAHMLGLAEPTIRSQVSRAVKRLVDVLGPQYRPPGDS